MGEGQPAWRCRQTYSVFMSTWRKLGLHVDDRMFMPMTNKRSRS